MRGRAFEAEVAEFLRRAGFEVTVNAKAASPRQTDLYAKGDGLDILVEAKNQKRSVDINDIDSLRSRLNRTSSDVVGAVFTTSGLTKGAIKAIETDRRREVLAFVREEIEQLRSGDQNLNTLIERKRTELRVQGNVWFGPESKSEYVGVKLPPSSVEFRIKGAASSFFESRSNFGGASYSLQIPDPGWGGAGGEGARLSVKLALNSVEDLRNIVGYLHAKFGLSSNGMFSIQQSGSCWYGVGADNFLDAVKNWRQRYDLSISKLFHHSESFIYFDQLKDGWLELSAQQRIGLEPRGKRQDSFLHHSELTIQLPGVPVDTSLYLKLCQYTGNDGAHFEYISQRWTGTFRLKTPTTIRAVGKITNRIRFPNESVELLDVIGIVAKNPFYRKRSLPKELLKSEIFSLHELSETELLVCALRDWHGNSHVVDRYRLLGFEVTMGGVGQIIQPFGTWNRILNAT